MAERVVVLVSRSMREGMALPVHDIDHPMLPNYHNMAGKPARRRSSTVWLPSQLCLVVLCRQRGHRIVVPGTCKNRTKVLDMLMERIQQQVFATAFGLLSSPNHGLPRPQARDLHHGIQRGGTRGTISMTTRDVWRLLQTLPLFRNSTMK